MRRTSGEFTLIDYGLSRHDLLPDLLAEEFRVPIGTGPYLSPEQIARDRGDPRSDLFALGVVLYYLLTGSSALRLSAQAPRSGAAAVARPGAAAFPQSRLSALAAGSHPALPGAGAGQAPHDGGATGAPTRQSRPDPADRKGFESSAPIPGLRRGGVGGRKSSRRCVTRAAWPRAAPPRRL